MQTVLILILAAEVVLSNVNDDITVFDGDCAHSPIGCNVQKESTTEDTVEKFSPSDKNDFCKLYPLKCLGKRRLI